MDADIYGPIVDSVAWEVQGDVKILQGDVRGLAAKIEAHARL